MDGFVPLRRFQNATNSPLGTAGAASLPGAFCMYKKSGDSVHRSSILAPCKQICENSNRKSRMVTQLFRKPGSVSVQARS